MNLYQTFVTISLQLRVRGIGHNDVKLPTASMKNKHHLSFNSTVMMVQKTQNTRDCFQQQPLATYQSMALCLDSVL